MNGKAIFQGGNAQSLNDVAGQPIAEYAHTKSGTVHKLEGPAKAKNIVFKATGDYSDGDTWTLNNTPVTVTYNGGEELLPTAVLIGDMVQAVVMGNQVRLMLQKPIPQPNILYNWYFVDPVNQKGQKEYTGGYNIDRWSFPQKVELTSEGISLVRTLVANNPPFSQKIPNLSNYTGKTLTFSVLAKTDKPDSFRCSIGGDTTYFAIKYIKASEDYMLCTVTAKVEDSGTCLLATIQDMSAALNHNPTIGDACHLVAAKLEPGNRFTGWPAWDYGTELVKCQKYFRVAKRWDFWKGIDVQPNYIDFPFPGLYGMRTKPAIINPEGFNLSKQGFTFELVSFGLSPRLRAAKTNHGLTGALLEANSNIYFDANL